MSGDTVDPQEGIPAPEAIALYLYDSRKRKLSLQTQMGLQGNREALTDMITAARKAASEHLVLDVPNFREQRPETLVTITDEVLKECTQIRKYRDGWPVSRYIRIYLKNHHPRGKKGRKPATRAKNMAGFSTPRARPGPGRHSAGFTAPRTPSVDQKPTDPMNKGQRTSASIETYQAGPSRPIASTPGALGAVPSFLYGLKFPAHDADKITVLFKNMGVEDKGYLEILATLELRDEWLEELREEGDLTPIQVRLLKEGLDRLGRNTK